MAKTGRKIPVNTPLIYCFKRNTTGESPWMKFAPPQAGLAEGEQQEKLWTKRNEVRRGSPKLFNIDFGKFGWGMLVAF